MSKIKRIILVAIAAIIVCAISVAGTLAYLTNSSGTVRNTFTAMGGGKLLDNFTLLETPVVQNPDGSYSFDSTGTPTTNNEYKVAPGEELPKDPYITITGKTEVPSYLYIEVVDGITGHGGMSWTIDPDWTPLMSGTSQVTGAHGGKVYYYTGSYAAAGIITDSIGSLREFNLIKDQKVVVADNTTIESFSGLELQFYCYICQASAGDNTPAGAFAAAF